MLHCSLELFIANIWENIRIPDLMCFIIGHIKPVLGISAFESGAELLSSSASPQRERRVSHRRVTVTVLSADRVQRGQCRRVPLVFVFICQLVDFSA